MSEVTNMTTTFADMVSEVYFLVNDDSETFPLADVKRAINNGLSTVYKQVYANSLTEIFTSLSIGRRSYPLPEARFEYGNAVVDGVYIDGTRLSEINPKPHEDTEANGLPTGYFVEGENIVFDPAPDLGTYVAKVRYGRDCPVLSADTDTVTMEDVAIHAALLYACYLLKMRDEEFESSGAFFSAYRESIGASMYVPGSVYDSSSHRVR